MNTPKSAFVAIFVIISTGLVVAPRTCQSDERPNSVRTIMLEAKALLDNGEASQAIAVLDAAIDEHGPIGKLVFLRGLSKQSAKHYEDAIEDLSRAISLECEVAQAYGFRGMCRQAVGERDLAIEDFNRAIEADLDLAVTYSMRGRFYYLDGQMQAAVEDFSTVIQRSPSAGAYIARACCYFAMGDWNALSADATAAARLDPDDPLPIRLRMHANAELGRADAALEDYRIANQLDEARSGR